MINAFAVGAGDIWGIIMMRSLKTIAHIETAFETKAGIPRQSGLIDELEGVIVFEAEYRVTEALRGLDGFSHLWLIWGFSENERESWMPTVRPPRLGGNRRMGVFATRSPFRPNALGLSCVRIDRLEETRGRGTVIHVRGADLMNGTPIYDIKPYLSFTVSHPDACNGFAGNVYGKRLSVKFERDQAPSLNDMEFKALYEVLSEDPRPGYHDDPERVYGFLFAGAEVKFRVCGRELYVISAEHITKE